MKDTVPHIPPEIETLPEATESPHSEQSISATPRTTTKKTIARLPIQQTDTVAKVGADTIPKGEQHYGIVLERPAEETHEAKLRNIGGMEGSWVMIGLTVIFIFVCLKFRNSRKYMQLLARDLTDTRRRDNMFDNTVRETSFLLLLNIMALLSMGVLLYFAFTRETALWAIGINDRAMGVCIGAGLIYGFFMWASYWITGTVFYNKSDARIWVRGYAAAQGLSGPIFFILALLALFYHEYINIILISALCIFVLIKLIFLSKGLRIFMRTMESLLLFFYYLCILELIPLIGVYAGAMALCEAIG